MVPDGVSSREDRADARRDAEDAGASEKGRSRHCPSGGRPCAEADVRERAVPGEEDRGKSESISRFRENENESERDPVRVSFSLYFIENSNCGYRQKCKGDMKQK